MASLRVAHPDINIKEEVSEYYIASDIRAIYSGMVIAVDYEDWSVFRNATIAQMAVLLVDLARACNLSKLQKKKRGVKKQGSIWVSRSFLTALKVTRKAELSRVF
jgi:hypothetical protein